MRFGVSGNELNLILALIDFVECFNDVIGRRLLLGGVSHIDAEFDDGGATIVLSDLRAGPTATGKRADNGQCRDACTDDGHRPTLHNMLSHGAPLLQFPVFLFPRDHSRTHRSENLLTE